MSNKGNKAPRRCDQKAAGKEVYAISDLSAGYVKLYRSLLESRVFGDSELLKVWVWCLLKASHKHRWITAPRARGTVHVELAPGQFLFGRDSASRELGMKPSSVNKRMKRLQAMGNLTMKSNSHGSIVSICNWPKFQGLAGDGEQPKEQPRNSYVTAKEQLRNTNKNVEKGKNVENVKKDGTRRDDHVCVSWNEELTKLVLALAHRVKQKMPINLARRRDDRELTLKVCYLVTAGVMPEDWIWDAVEAVKNGKLKSKPAAYWWTCLERAAEKRGKPFRRLLADIDVPEGLLAARRKPLAGG